MESLIKDAAELNCEKFRSYIMLGTKNQDILVFTSFDYDHSFFKCCPTLSMCNIKLLLIYFWCASEYLWQQSS